MMRSLFAGVSGLKNHQTRMDVIGNNISNVNTVGFKKSRVTFQDMLSQTLRGASAATANRAGTNPMQVGLGMSLGSIDVIHTGGSPQSTGKNTDLSIEGDGYFLLGEGNNTYYTRAGNFEFDVNKTFYHTSTGLIVKGYLADAAGNISADSPLSDINLASQASSDPRATSLVNYGKNLDSRATGYTKLSQAHTSGTPTTINCGGPIMGVFIAGLTIGTDYTVNESTGEITILDTTANGPYEVYYTEPTIINDYDHTNGIDSIIDCKGVITDVTIAGLVEGTDYTVDYSSGKITINKAVVDGDYDITYTKAHYQAPIHVYDSKGETHTATAIFTKIADNVWEVDTVLDGKMLTNGKGRLTFSPTDGRLISSTVTNFTASIDGADPLNIALNFGNITEYAGDYSIFASGQDGYESGDLTGIAVDTSGTITGSFSNGQSRKLAQIALATFANPSGLLKVGNNMFQPSNNSGIADTGLPGVSGRGIIKPETLEMSNVDLSEEFVDMIITQRGFQANSRVITTSDQILEELVNLRR